MYLESKLKEDQCRLLKLDKWGKKSRSVRMPALSSKESKIHFLRGYFDGDGFVKTTVYPERGIASVSVGTLDDSSSLSDTPPQ